MKKLTHEESASLKIVVANTKQTDMKKADEELEKEIIRLYVEEGYSPYGISKLFDGYITHSGVRKILLRNKVQMRNRSEVKTVYKLPMDKIINQYTKQKISTYRLGKMYNVPPAVIWYHLNRLGVATRTLTESKVPDRSDVDAV